MNNPISFSNIRNIPRKNKVHLLKNICIGCLIAIAFHFMEYTDRGENAINFGLDKLIYYEKKKELKKTYQGEQLLFVDINHKAYQKWKEPSITPRNKIAEIIKYAYDGGARIIVLDIKLEDRDCCNEEGEKILRKVLEKEINANSSINAKPSIKIIFPVSIKHDGRIKENLFDDLIDNNDNFYRATPGITATSGDLKYRYWISHKIVKYNNEDTDTVLWGLPLLAAVLSEGGIDELGNIEKEILINHKSSDNKVFKYKIKINEENIIIPSKTEELYSQRIRYFIIPNRPDGPNPKIGNIRDKGYVPAAALKESLEDSDKKKILDKFKDKIVVIGNSYPDAGDIISTPIGPIPGMYVIGNSIYTIINNLHLKRTPLWFNVIVEIVAIIIASYFFICFSSFLAKILVTIVVLSVFIPASWYIFRLCDVYFNFVLPITGIGLYEMICGIEECFMDKGMKKNS